ncbi:MAG: succinyl-CoA synthetase subunit alpha [Actinobacteria bacterium]|nr:succinyl-CoA synthetase subunit alpha [Actinomycetota bacterium]
MIPAKGDGVVIQGITGRQGSYWTERMLACGTNIVAGVSPSKAGEKVCGIPVYSSVGEALSYHKATISVLFTPPLATRGAAMDALDGGIEGLVLLSEFVPVHDTMWILAEAAQRSAQVLGPNTAGLVVPGQCSLGIMPGFAPNIFQPGNVAVVSRSGSLGTLVCLDLVASGLGESVFMGLGGDPIVGTTTAQALLELEADPKTSAVVVVGEVGGTMEEDAAEVVASMSKPVVGFIAGRTAPPGRKMGHAGAIVSGNRGDPGSKVKALEQAGAHVVEVPSAIPAALVEVMPALAS